MKHMNWEEFLAGLNRSRSGDVDASDDTSNSIYETLRDIAARIRRREPRNHSLESTELVHEALMRFGPMEELGVENRQHFLALFARQVRYFLVDYARKRQSKKGRGGICIEPFDDARDQVGGEGDSRWLLPLNDALERLSMLDARQAMVVELHFFVGLNYREIAADLGVCTRTVGNYWESAKAWLHSELDEN